MENPSCVFCDKKNFTERVVYENESAYVIASLGQITDGGYLLLVPKIHASCMGAMAIGQQVELLKLLFLSIALSHDLACHRI